ncbi:hypothetical protein GCM10028789_28360 [Sinomonas halotolerans]
MEDGTLVPETPAERDDLYPKGDGAFARAHRLEGDGGPLVPETLHARFMRTRNAPRAIYV